MQYCEMLMGVLLLTDTSSRKAQAMPTDFTIGLFIFLVLLGYFLVQWSLFSERYWQHAQVLDKERTAIRIADQLVSSIGQPFNWSEDPLDAQSIGLASGQNKLDYYKVEAFASLPYAYAKQFLGTDDDFYIRLESLDGLQMRPLMGFAPSNTTRVIEITRVAIYEGTIMNIKVQTYEN